MNKYEDQQIEDILSGDLYYCSKCGNVLTRDKLRQCIAQLYHENKKLKEIIAIEAEMANTEDDYFED